MSGQPVKKPGDVNKYYNDYMEALNLTAMINDTNLQANKNFLLNGILPAVSQMKDGRTTSELLGDIEKQKSAIASSIAKISNMQFGYGVVNALLKSPLNVDNKLIQFMAQRGDEFIEKIKKSYKVGIKGDINDIDVMVLHIEDFFNKTYNTIQSVKGYLADNSQNSMYGNTRNNIVTGANINQITQDLENIIVSMASKYGKANDASARRWGNIHELRPVMERLTNLVQHIRRFAKYGLPSNELINQTRDNLIHAIDQQSNASGYTDLTPNEIAYQTLLKDQDVMDTLEQYNEYITILEGLPKPTIASVYTLLSMLEQKIKANNIKGFDDVITSLEDLFAFVFERNMTPPLIIRRLFDQPDAYFGPHAEHMGPHAARPDEQQHVLEDRFRPSRPDMPRGINPFVPIGPLQPYQEQPDDVPEDQLSQQTEQGQGLRRGKLKRSNFRGFGLAEINHKKLDMGVLSIRRPSKGNYKTVPQQRISSTLQHIVKDIDGGRIPNFNDINSLSSDEKDYLHKVVSASGFDDKLSIPSPNKDVVEKEIHTFEVMKGERLAGNDSKALIKKFKILILKLSNKGTLPKKEANDVLYTLLSLGY